MDSVLVAEISTHEASCKHNYYHFQFVCEAFATLHPALIVVQYVYPEDKYHRIHKDIDLARVQLQPGNLCGKLFDTSILQ